MRVRTRYVAAIAIAAAAAAHAGPENVQFPSGYLKGERYYTIDRPDIKQYREFYTQADVVEAVRKGQPIPSGAGDRLTDLLFTAGQDRTVIIEQQQSVRWP